MYIHTKEFSKAALLFMLLT